MPDDPVYLVPYDPTWPSQFEEERAQLARVLSPWLVGPIEHIGSTAVPGLTAKPVIDIMAGVRDLPSSLDARAALAPLNYENFPHRPDVMHWFCKPSPARRTHHLHLVPVQSALWAERVLFRDYLRSSSATAAEYAALKVALAVRHQFDREAYTEAKGAFVRSILDRAHGQTERPASSKPIPSYVDFGCNRMKKIDTCSTLRDSPSSSYAGVAAATRAPNTISLRRGGLRSGGDGLRRPPFADHSGPRSFRSRGSVPPPGPVRADRLLVVVHVERAVDEIRNISARPATRVEAGIVGGLAPTVWTWRCRSRIGVASA